MILCLLFSGCAIAPSDHQNKSNGLPFDKITLDQDKGTVTRNLGSASEVRISSDNEELWIYNQNNDVNSQLGAVSFSPETQLVTSKTVVPQAGDPEKDISFLINQKFKTTQFEKIPLQKCNTDYFPTEIFYISQPLGIIIKFDSHLKAVKNISWTNSEYAATAIKKIKSCAL